MVMGKQYNQIDLEERDQIAILRAEGRPIREISRILGRHHSTIIRELDRNTPPINKGYYLPSKAHDRAAIRKQQAAYRSKLKDNELREYIITHLKLGWSPEIIAGRLGKDYPGRSVSHETIYRYIYNEAPHLRRFLPRKHRKRWKKGQSRKHQKVHIPERVSISARSPQVNQRIRFGHWEGDTMEGLRTEKPALNVLVERKSRILQLTKLPDRTAHSTQKTIVERLRAIPRKARRSITYDNGHENTRHYKVNRKLKMRSYFCDPYRSWEKGTVEQTIGLVRRFIPKGWDITTVSPAFIKRIEYLLNHRPRKCLDFATPLEVFNKLSGALAP